MADVQLGSGRNAARSTTDVALSHWGGHRGDGKKQSAESALVGALSVHQQGAAKFLRYFVEVGRNRGAYTAWQAAKLSYRSIR